jgi:hypothetical protein
VIFWILLTLAVIATIGTFIWALNDTFTEWFEAIALAAAAGLLSALVGGLALLGFMLIPANHIRPHHYALASLGSTQGVSGEFFLGSGTVNGARELTYVKQDGDHYVATEADGDSSFIYQDTSGPSVTEYEWFYANGWVLPWNFDTGWSYDFHVPKGTILNDYRIG